MTAMKAPLKYYGGKQRLAHKIVPLLPRHAVYVEPFCGGAAVFWAKPVPRVRNDQHYREVLNDLDLRVVSFFRALQNKQICKELLWRLKMTPYSYAELYRAKDILKSPESHSLVDVAWAFYVNTNLSFGSVWHGGFGRGVYGPSQPKTFHKKVKRLKQVVSRLKSVVIDCIDAIECIKKWDSPQTLFYCDPPYVMADCEYRCQYSNEDYLKLLDVLSGCMGSFLLSTYDHPAIPKDWERFEFDTICSVRGEGKTNRKRTGRSGPADLEKIRRKEMVFRVIRNKSCEPEMKAVLSGDEFGCFKGDGAAWDGQRLLF